MKKLDTKIITKIIELMKDSDLTEFQIEEEGLKLCIKRGLPTTSYISSPNQVQLLTPQTANPIHTDSSPAKPVIETNVHIIKSPMVGTFYKSSSPDNPPFINVGDKVEKTTTVCILEAMKVMNEIHAEVQGTVIEVLAENGQTIEYGQPLFKVKLG
ncbi:MAG: acetyl-CoA carboxylase biotin carboxyl carrier protein [Verrucomicrobia bacterium]|nr:MAG: acetyl-CoA carboxylase biotin carboxyl carrier protein [Verrucomicrobiota bacterium]